MTTSAAKDMFLPPLTTLVTRLIETTSSLRLRRFASIFFFIAIMSYPAFWRPMRAPWETLEIETRFAGCVGEGFDTAVVEVAATIEDHLLDALLFRALGDERANLSRCGDVADLLLQLLAGVADALVLVGVRLAKRAHVGGDLAYLLPVDAGDGEVCLLGVDGDLDAGGQGELDGVRVAEGEYDHVLALHLGAVPDADDVDVLGPAGGDAGDGVIDQRAGEAVEGCLLVCLAVGDKGAILLDEGDAAGKHGGDFALGAFDQDGVAADRVLDASG